jgi:hypothetical protein
MAIDCNCRLPKADRVQLEVLQRQAIQYFIDNQLSHGLVLDRQRNLTRLNKHGLCSTSGTGMGLIAIALASAPQYQMLSRREAIARVRLCLRTALERLPREHGMMPHFVDSDTLAPVGMDVVSTIDSAWLVAGGLWAAEFLRDQELSRLAAGLYERIDWRYWAGGDKRGWLHHGIGMDGKMLEARWDRLNGETAFMYVLAIGAREGRELSSDVWGSLRKRYGKVAGRRFVSADLGLFAFQYSLQLLDFKDSRWPGRVDLFLQAKRAVAANHEYCSRLAGAFKTYRRFWGLSAGDGPGGTDLPDMYRAYAPGVGVDGTAHLTASIASIDVCPELVLANLRAARHSRIPGLHGRYGLSNVNVDRRWVSRDVVAIDLGAEVLALDNFLHGGRVRATFQRISCIRR